MKKLTVLAAILGLVALSKNALAYGGGYSCPYGFGMWGGGPMMILFWLLIIVLVVVGVRWVMANGGSIKLPGGQNQAAKPDSALEILRKRYAEGEIDAETYQKMKGDLEK